MKILTMAQPIATLRSVLSVVIIGDSRRYDRSSIAHENEINSLLVMNFVYVSSNRLRHSRSQFTYISH